MIEKIYEVYSGYFMNRDENGVATFGQSFLSPDPNPFTEAEALGWAAQRVIDPGRLRLEKRQEGDCVRQPDGSYLVTYRFTLLPEAEADEPVILKGPQP